MTFEISLLEFYFQEKYSIVLPQAGIGTAPGEMHTQPLHH